MRHLVGEKPLWLTRMEQDVLSLSILQITIIDGTHVPEEMQSRSSSFEAPSMLIFDSTTAS